MVITFSRSIFDGKTRSRSSFYQNEMLAPNSTVNGRIAIQRLICQAGFRDKAFLEEMDYSINRGLDRNQTERLASLDFIRQGQNLFITWSSGTGKSYIATALGYRARKEGKRTNYAGASRSCFRDWLFNQMLSSACSKSEIKSSICSVPMDKRTVPG